MIWVTLIIACCYVFNIAVFSAGWLYLEPFSSETINPNITVSVIIPMRNEAENIESLLYCLQNQNYPAEAFQIILVDDHSTDNSLTIIENIKMPNIKVMQMQRERQGKKAALQRGIEASDGKLIITTDADCVMGREWIRSYVNYYQKYQPVMMLGPVRAQPGKSNFAKVQALEMLSLLGSTAGAAAINHHIMCNGANLAFARSVYPEIRHVYNNPGVSSGDDIFVLQELKKKYRHRIKFIKSKEVAIYTKIADSLPSFFKQRKRWVAKAPHYFDSDIIVTALIILVTNLWLLTTLFLGLLSFGFKNFLLLMLMKSLIDFLFLYRLSSFFGEKKLLRWFPIVQSIYFVYVSITFFLAVFIPGTWKNRKLNHLLNSRK